MKRIVIYAFISLTLYMFIESCRRAKPVDYDERMSGGDCTIFDESATAFGQPIPGMTERDMQVHELGDHFFGLPFIAGQATAQASGLGPVYNQTSCVRCHVNDGRGMPPLPGQGFQSMFIKLSMPGIDVHGAPLPVPGFGVQLQDKAVAGITPEGSALLSWFIHTEKLADGTIVDLRQPSYTLTNLYTSIPAGAMFSARVARPNFGVGLLEAISDESILKNADPDDLDRDGISGRVNYVYDYANGKENVIGRLGWKATVPNIKTFVGRALNEDIGITSYIFPNENCAGQTQASVTPVEDVDFIDSLANALVFYIRTLAVPARRNVNDLKVIKGKLIFKEAGCVKCHVSNHTTKVDVSFSPLSGQHITPYTDLLLHDMGGALADGRPDFVADGFEWRTPPLWGIGLTEKVSGHTLFLHDGRARNFTEAIMWHGGEAGTAKYNFTQLNKEDREALLAFLNSL